MWDHIAYYSRNYNCRYDFFFKIFLLSLVCHLITQLEVQYSYRSNITIGIQFVSFLVRANFYEMYKKVNQGWKETAST